MENNKRSIFQQNWFRYIGIYIAIQIIFISLDHSPPKFNGGALFDRLSESIWFTENFAPYETPQFNLFTAFFTIILVPSVIISLVVSRKKSS